MRRCAASGCTRLASAVCGKCGVAAYCSKVHQKLAWRMHRKWCALTGAAVPGATCSLVFVGQRAQALKELCDSPTLGDAALAAATAPRRGWVALPTSALSVQAALGGGDDDIYYPLGKAEAPEALRARCSPAIVVPRRTALLSLYYCLGTQPAFLLTAPPGAAGLTAADLISATARAHQFCYEKEGERPPSVGMLLNRPPSSGPFHISMHDLGDLVLHTLNIRGVQPEGGGGQEGGGDSSDAVTVVITAGIDS